MEDRRRVVRISQSVDRETHHVHAVERLIKRRSACRLPDDLRQ